MIKNIGRIFLVALLAGWLFDFLFWENGLVGIAYPVFVIGLAAGGLFLARKEGLPPARLTLILFVPIFLLALLVFLRLEPMTVFLGVVLSVSLLGMLAYTFQDGRWLQYSLTDYTFGLLAVSGSSVYELPAAIVTDKKERAALEQIEDGDGELPPRESFWKQYGPWLRGVLIALPVLWVFTGLLASADPVFESRVVDFLDIFDIENLDEYIFRSIYIVIFAYLFAGVYLHALKRSAGRELVGLERKVWSPFLGFTEASVVLGSVNLLFAAFVVVQFQYFFGSQANITVEGYTFAEYARKGFGELVIVAFFSLLMFLALSTFAKREQPKQRRTFSLMGVVLALLVGVILVSAFQRLLLYESAFGFTRMRTYPHVFMIWLGALLLAFVVLEFVDRMRFIGLASLVASVGFALTLGFLNVDGMIAQQNLARTLFGYTLTTTDQFFDSSYRSSDLDNAYLFTLTHDSVPALFEAFRDGRFSENIHIQVGVLLVCQQVDLNKELADQPWQNFHFSTWRASRLYETYANELTGFKAILSGRDGLEVLTPGGELHPCRSWSQWD